MEEHLDAPHGQSRTDENRRDEMHRLQRSHFYELLVGIALLYGFLVYFVWQQAERRIIAVEQELMQLQSEIASLPDFGSDLASDSWAEAKTPAGSATTEFSTSTNPHRFITRYLRFEASKRTADMVQSLARQSDAKYRQLHQDWELPLPSPSDELIIIVDPLVGVNYPFTDAETLVVPFPQSAVARYSLTESEVLMNEISIRLVQHVFDKAVQSREFKPQWHAMTEALESYLRLEHGHRQQWQLETAYLARRHAAQIRTIDQTQQATGNVQAQTEAWLSSKRAAKETADPLIEYLLETYGYAKVPALLNAFEVHGSWETLAPTLFGMTVRELEADWHAYLKQQYPLPDED